MTRTRHLPVKPTPETLERLAAVVGPRYALNTETDMAPYLSEWRDKYVGRAAMVLRPASREEVSGILTIANETRTAIVPQGGNTGLVGAQIPFEHGHEVVLSLSRLDRIRSIDPANNTLTTEAGAVLARIQEAAEEADRLFPLSLGAEGSCQIGGNLSSNAGGTQVLAYGNARELTLGLEVVLADGRILDVLGALRKDNTGYDLKDLFIGAEGTLGVITAAVLKLFPRPRSIATAFAGAASPAKAVDMLALAQDLSANRVTGLEIVPRIGLDMVLKHMRGARDPFDKPYPWYLLIELSGGMAPDDMEGVLGEVLEAGLERNLIEDAVPAASEAQRRAFWDLRNKLSESQKPEGASIKHDVSVPVSRLARFLKEAIEAAERVVPGSRPVPFGHLGDGNIHFNVSQPKGMSSKKFLGKWDEMNEAVHAVVLAHHGSISAEHGIGRLKRDLLGEVKDDVALDVMRALKATLDPNNILNPGKLLPDA